MPGSSGSRRIVAPACPRPLVVRVDVIDLDEVAVDHPGIVVRPPRGVGLGAHGARARVAVWARDVDRGAVELELRVRDPAAVLVPLVALLPKAEGPLQPVDRAAASS